jgi:hypothetical protein
VASSNDITGARLVTKPNTKEYEEGYDRIFGKKEFFDEDKRFQKEKCIIHDNEKDVIND